MPIVEIVTLIRAPIERCFDLARDLDLHARSLGNTGERAVAGVTSGLISLGEEVTWEAKHFGVRQRLTSRITIFERPCRFRDSMVRGAFASFDHDHLFEHRDGMTTMRDIFDYRSPLGVLGRLADTLFLKRYMTQLIETRAVAIRSAAEA